MWSLDKGPPGRDYVLKWEGEDFSYFISHWYALEGLKVAKAMGNPHHIHGTTPGDKFTRLMRRVISREVPCDKCGANKGSPCVRPSEHPVMYGGVHAARRDAMDNFINNKDKELEAMMSFTSSWPSIEGEKN